MQKQIQRLLRWWYVAGAGAGLLAVQGCNIDPDIKLRAALSAGSDLAIFLLENLAHSL